MNDELFEPAVRDALGRLTTDEPPLGFSPSEVLGAGRTRRRRHTRALAGTSLAAAAAVAAAIAVPAALWSSGPSAEPSNRVGNSAQPSATPSPQASASDLPLTHTCGRPTDAQWNMHLAFEAKLRAILPQISGRLTSDINRESDMCTMHGAGWRHAKFAITRSKTVGSVSATVSTPPGAYRNVVANDPCKGVPPTQACTLIRRGGAVIQVAHATVNGAQAEPAKSIYVTAVWPDDTTVEVVAATTAQPEQTSLPLPSIPLTEQQLIDLALNPELRS